MKRIYLFALMFFLVLALWAENQVSISHELSFQATTNVEAMIGFTSYFRFPFMQVPHCPLRDNNNITVALGAEATPISFRGISEVIWTPIAFLELSAGGDLGSGWIINVFDDDKYGIGLNSPDSAGRGEHSGSSFDGIHWKVQAGAALQADLAAFFPGEWNHVVMRTYHEINHRGYNRASSRQSWFFENDDGENLNGLNYYGNLILGYQMPIILSMVGFIAEAELFLYDTPNRRQWGDDRIYWIFSALLNFSLSEKLDVGMAAQFHTKRNYLEANWEDLYYQNRSLNKSNPVSLEFYRVALAMTYKF